MTAAGLITASEAAGKRRAERRAAEFDQIMVKQREASTRPPKERNLNRWTKEKREQRLEQMKADLASGALVIKKLSPDELREYERRAA